MNDGGLGLIQLIKEGDSIAVCDGSFKEGFGTAAWF